MIKPKGFDESSAFVPGESATLPPGGYVCKIVRAKEEKSRSGKQMLTIAFDICEGEFADFYANKQAAQKAKDPNADVRWGGVYRQLTEGDSLPFFKGMIASLEDSNPGWKWMWDEKTLVGLKFGGLFGREEFEAQDGRVLMTTRLFYIRSVNGIKGVEAPADKLLNSKAASTATGGKSSHIGGITDDDVPF